MSDDPFHDRLLEMVLRLPGAYEDRPWGSVHCKVDGKIFVGWGRHDGEMELGFRTHRELQAMLVASDPRFRIAKYVGQYGGVDMRLGPRPDWQEVEQFIVESYRMIAPKKRIRELDAGTVVEAGAKKGPVKKVAAKKAVAKKGPVKKVAAKKVAAKKAPAKKAAAQKVAAKKARA